MEKDWIDLEGFKGLRRMEKIWKEKILGRTERVWKDGEGLEGKRRFGRTGKSWKNGEGFGRMKKV